MLSTWHNESILIPVPQESVSPRLLFFWILRKCVSHKACPRMPGCDTETLLVACVELCNSMQSFKSLVHITLQLANLFYSPFVTHSSLNYHAGLRIYQSLLTHQIRTFIYIMRVLWLNRSFRFDLLGMSCAVDLFSQNMSRWYFIPIPK